MKMTITTKGVQGSSALLREFAATIEDELAKHLQAYKDDTVDKMQTDAPVRTGYLRQSIKSYFPTPTSVAINSWAPYSGYVNFGTSRMVARPYFTTQVEQGPVILEKVFGQASINHLNHLISKHQNTP